MLRDILTSKIAVDIGNIIGTIQLGKAVLVCLLVFCMFSYDTYMGFSKRLEVQQYADLDNINYVVSGKNCRMLFDGDTLNVLDVYRPAYYPQNFVVCPPQNTQFLQTIAFEHEGKTRAVHNKDLYFIYGFAFIMFVMLNFITLRNSHVPNIALSLNRLTIVASWLFISLLMFPMVYRDYGNSATHEYNGQEYFVTSVVMTNDGKEFITASESFLSMNRDLMSNFPANLRSY